MKRPIVAFPNGGGLDLLGCSTARLRSFLRRLGGLPGLRSIGTRCLPGFVAASAGFVAWRLLEMLLHRRDDESLLDFDLETLRELRRDFMVRRLPESLLDVAAFGLGALESLRELGLDGVAGGTHEQLAFGGPRVARSHGSRAAPDRSGHCQLRRKRRNVEGNLLKSGVY